jgi:hypothetical protein
MRSIVLSLLLLSTSAQAEDWKYGLHVLSFHKPGSHMQTITPGAYALHTSGVTLGAYRNSLGKFSSYAGYSTKYLTLGVVTGYPRAKLLLMVVPSYKFESGYRVSLIPNPWGQSAIHLSKEL